MKKIVMLFAVAVFACACSKYLDVKPMGKLIPEKAVDFNNMLNNSATTSYLFFDAGRTNFLAYTGDNVQIMRGQEVQMFTPENAPILDRYAAYKFYLPYQDPRQVQMAWRDGIYRHAGIYNTIVDGIAALPAAESDTEYARGVVAQARAARAWTYMVGGLCYGSMWNPGGANDKASIPYRLDADPSVPNPKLATTAELFELVFKDLEYALANAPDQVTNPTRANLTAVKAMIAEYYMYKRDWPNMLKYADEAWEEAKTQLGGEANMIYDYNTWNYGSTPAYPPGYPSAWLSVTLQAPVGFNQSWAIENLFFRTSPDGSPSQPYFGDGDYPSQEYIDLFQAGDQRARLFMLNDYAIPEDPLSMPPMLPMNYRDGKLRVGSTTESTSEGITFPLLLLMRAEAYWRTGDMGKALADLNTLRGFRYDATNAELTGLTGDDLMVEILRERRIEQPMTSFQRILDLKRFVYDIGKPWCKTSITHTLDSETFTAPINDTYFTLPLSNDAIIRNPQWGLKTNDTPWTPAG